MKVEQIKSNLLNSNVFVITKNEHAIIIDAGVELEKIKPFIEENIVDGILLTHGHYDHAFYAVDYARAFGCKIFASPYIKETLSDPGINYSDGSFFVKDFDNFAFLEDEEKLCFENFCVKPLHTKGHSKCSVCYIVGEDIFVGDTLFKQGMGRTDLIGGNNEELEESLSKLEAVPYKNLYAGHGDSSTHEEQLFNIKACKRYLKIMGLQKDSINR